MDYPSPNFVRPSLVNLEDAPQEVSIDEGNRLTIKLHYNPVMDEWISLTEESASLSESQAHDLDTLFDLHKRVAESDGGYVESIHMGHFLTVSS